MQPMIKTTLHGLFSAAVVFSATAFSAMANDAYSNHASTDTAHHITESSVAETIKTKGVVKLIDTDSQKLTIAHEPIPAINWPAMTMRFTYEDPSMIADIKEGSQVDLDFIQQGNISLLTKITVTQ